MKKLKSLISVLLCAVLVLGMLPVHAHATVEDPQLVLYLYDACGDGWDGASIEMFDGTETHTFTVEYDDDVLPISYDPDWTDGTGAEYHIPLNPSLTYSFRWSSGMYDDECSFEIYLDGEELYSCGDASALDDGEEFYVYAGCSHSSMTEGVCADCGGTCGVTFPHKVAGTACNFCGGVCGVDFAHKLVDGVCTDCGDSVSMYLVTVEECANGSVTAYPSLAAAGELVQLAPAPNNGYTLENFTVIDDNGQEITVTDDQFRMPDTHVTVTATFTKRIGDFVVTGNDNWYVDDDGDLRLTASGDYTISMKPGVESSDQTIFLSEMGTTVNLTLDNVSCAQIKGDNTTVNMTLVGENAFNGAPGGYGSLTMIRSLTVSGTGSLAVKNSFFGDLTVNSGSVTVSRYSDYCLEGNLTVNGGTVDVINTTGTDHIAVTGDVTVKDGIVNITTVAASAIGQNLIVEKGTVTVMGEPAVAGMVIPGGDLIETFLAGESAETAEPIDFDAGQMYQGEKYLKLTLVECQHEEIGEDRACTACGRVCGIGFDHQPDENNVCLKCASALYKVTVQCGPFGTVELSPDLCVAGQIVRVVYTGKLLSMTITADNGEPVEVNPTYDFKMPASDVTVTARFAKAIRFVLEDSYGDGWNGNALVVIDEDGNTVETVTIETGDNYEKEVALDPCKRYTIQWHADRYPSECSFKIMQGNETLMSAEECNNFTDAQDLLTIDGAHDPDATGTCANCGGICGQDFDHQPGEANTCTFCGAVCTVYSVTVNKLEAGTVTAPDHAYAGQTVRLQVSQGLKTITVTDANGEEVEISEDYTFVMPDSDVTITAAFYDLLEIQMKDLGYDGWNGNALVVIDEDGNTQTITFQTGGAHTETVGVDPCKRYTIQWQAGNYSYECSFLIKLNGALLMEATAEDADAFENEKVLLTLDAVHRLNATGTCTNCGAVFTVYPVTVAQTEHGTVSASFAAAYEGRKIRLTVMPEEDFALKSLTVTDEEGNEIPVTDNCFVMPASGVTVTAAFEKDSGDFVITGDSGWRVVDGDVEFYESGSYTVTMKEGITESDATFYFGEGEEGTFDITLVNVTTAIFWDAYGNCTVNLTLVGDNVIKGDQYNNSSNLKALSVGGTGSLTVKTCFHADLTVNSGTVRFTGKTGYEYHGIGINHPGNPSLSVVVNGGTLIVNGGDGRNGEDVEDADGYNGGHAIFGDLIVNGGKVILTGGKGGKAHRYMEGGVDGTDGIAVSGTVTIGQGAALRTFVAGEDADTATAVTAYNGERYLKLDVLAENSVDQISLSLEDSIGINFYTYLSDDAKDSAYMVFKIGNRTLRVEESTPVTLGGVEYQVFSVPTYAKEMGLSVEAQLFWGDEETPKTYTYSVRQYADTVLADETASEELKQLLRDMLQYGAYAQKQFAFNTDDLANTGISGAGDIASVTRDQLTKVLEREGSGSLTLKTLSLSLRDTVSMNLYFEAAEGIAGITVKHGEEALALMPTGNGLYSVRIHGIAAKDLDKPVTVTITEAGGTSYTITVIPLTYAAVVLESQQSESLVDLVKSMYLYHTSAAAYLASLNG